MTGRNVIITVLQRKSCKLERGMKSIPVLTEKDIKHLERSLAELIQAKFRKTGLPFVTIKYAQTLDGKIATATGDSRWISGPSSLRLAHHLRSWHDAVMVGVSTIIRDDPLLTVRLAKGRNPQKIILESRLRTPLASRILRGRSAQSTIFAATDLASRRRIERLRSAGAQVWVIKRDSSGRVDLRRLLDRLSQAGIRSVLVEGGSKVVSSFLDHGLADHLLVVVAPKLMGKGIVGVNIETPAAGSELLSHSSVRCFMADGDLILHALSRSQAAGRLRQAGAGIQIVS